MLTSLLRRDLSNGTNPAGFLVAWKKYGFPASNAMDNQGDPYGETPGR